MKILTYGFLTNSAAMPDGATRLGPAVLHGYRWEMLQFANVFVSRGNSFLGILWEIDDVILKELDRREGYPHLYERVQVSVELDSGPELAWVYTMTPDSRKMYEGSTPSDYYFDTVAQGYAEDNMPLPEYYENSHANC